MATRVPEAGAEHGARCVMPTTNGHWRNVAIAAGSAALACCIGGWTCRARSQTPVPPRPVPPEAAHQEPPAPADTQAALIERSTRFYERTCYFKPAAGLDDLDAYQAPLIFQALSDDGAECPAAACFGQVRPDGTVDVHHPTVYYGRTTLPRADGDHRQDLFVWVYPAAPGSTALAVQGLRITFSIEGLPAIWEVLANDSAARLIFVAHFLEAAATRQYGVVLPGRRFAVERPVRERPDVVVARVLDDSPVPLGPIVYLTPRRAVSTVICRCMSSQAGESTRPVPYQLLPLHRLEVDLRQHLNAAGRLDLPLAFDVDSSEQPQAFEERLRLPDGF